MDLDLEELAPGRHRKYLLVGENTIHEPTRLPIHIVVGAKPGPRVYLTAAVHGDEINGIAVVREVMESLRSASLKGTVIGVPVVNIPGFRRGDRYTPDRRDLNRSFPGDPKGSMAKRLADAIMESVIRKCDYGIDLHTAADGRTNLCHVRGDSSNEAVRQLMRAFGTPVLLHGEGPKGSLRREATKAGVPSIIYEAGEPNRFEPHVVEIGVTGVLRVLRHLGMVRRKLPRKPAYQVLLKKSEWLRAPHGGILELQVQAGDLVRKNQKLGIVLDPFGREVVALKSPLTGVVLGLNTKPLAYQGEAVVHVGQIRTTIKEAKEYVRLGGDLGHTAWNAKANADAKSELEVELEEPGSAQMDEDQE